MEILDRWWSLPGPAAFVARIIEDLRSGRSCLIRMPQAFDVAALTMAVRRAIAIDYFAAWDCFSLGGLEAMPPIMALSQLFNGEFHSARGFALAPELAGRVIWLDGWSQLSQPQCSDWRNLLEQYAHAPRQQAPHNHTMFCLPLVGDDTYDVGAGEDVLLAQQWWWGATSRLDLALLIDYLEGGDGFRGHLRNSILSNLAGFDPRRAIWLAQLQALAVDSVCASLQQFAKEFALGEVPTLARTKQSFLE